MTWFTGRIAQIWISSEKSLYFSPGAWGKNFLEAMPEEDQEDDAKDADSNEHQNLDCENE